MAQGLPLDPNILGNMLRDVTTEELATCAKILSDQWIPESAGVQKVGHLLWKLHLAKSIGFSLMAVSALPTSSETVTLSLPTMPLMPGIVDAMAQVDALFRAHE
jgi:hypothetical protein